MPSYSPSTISRISDLINGLQCDTSNLAAATYLAQNQVELFNYVGRIKIHNLFLEVTTVFSNNATTVLFNTTSTTPVIAVQPLCAASASVAQLAVAERVFFVGGAVATAAVLTATPGISDINVTPHIVGGKGGTGTLNVGTIGILSAAASLTSGNFRASIYWSAMEPGAYVEAVL
jgi:hypothetical protein